MRKSLTLLAVLVCSCMLALAQTKQISGKITDSKGSPVPGVTIKVKGSRAGTSADADGNFTLKASPTATLIISGIGFETQQVAVADRDNLTIALKASDASLSEVVVTALGIRREKRLLTYATQEVKGSTLVEAKQDNLVNALSGKVAGVQITNSSGMPGSSARITIRGIASLTGENQPLFVIDGIPIDMEEAGNPDNPLFAGGTANRAADIDPNIIESINILKGSAATAIYGSSAARGAVIITTKTGARGAKPTVSVSSSYGIASPILPEFQSKYAQGSNGIYSFPSSTSYGPLIDTLKINGVAAKKYNNVKDFFKNGHTTDNNISVTGSTDKSSYLASYSYLKTDGNEETTNYIRHSFFAKYSTKLLSNLNLVTQFNYIHSDNHRLLEGNGLQNPIWTVYAAPISWNPLPYLNPDGSQQLYRTARNNPYWLVHNTGLDDKTDRILPALTLTYNPLPWLTITERLGADIYTNITDYRENVGFVGNSDNGRMWKRNNDYKQFNNDLIVNARKDFGNFSLDVLVGNNILTNYNSSNYVEGTDLSIPGFYNISNASTVSSSYNYYRNRRIGFYAQATLEYAKMLTLSLTGRYDGSSVLSKDKQFYPYGSISGGFIFTEPLGMASNPIFNFGKLRLSYSSVGNDNVPPYSLSNPWYHNAVGNINLPYNGVNGFQFTTTYGFPLKNEGLTEYEAGLETKFFQNRVSLDVTYFYRKSKDLLTLGVPYAPETGFPGVNINAGDMYNKGVEVVLGVTPIKTRDFSWDLSVNYTKIKNKVTRLAPNINDIQFAGFVNPGIFAFANEPYGVIYGTDFVRDSATHKLLLDDNGKPQVDVGNHIIGNATPNWLGGLTNTFNYKGIILSFTLDMKKGGNILNLDKHYLYAYGTPKETEARGTTKIFDGIIESTGKQSTIPVVLDQAYFANIASIADVMSVEDAGYFKLRQASLGYNFGNTLLKGNTVKNLTLTVTATNFILHKNYTGSDPEVSLNGSGNGQGFSSWNVPSNHNIIIGLKASF
jgi:TonB-linked SusC/RagA family outer membrane protein